MTTLDKLIGILIRINLMLFAVIVLMLIGGQALACTADIGTSTTEVYVRDSAGEIAGSLKKGDKVIVTGKKGGWCKVDIGGTAYRVWGEYLSVERGVCLDEVEVLTKPRKSRDKSNGIKNKQKASIKGSVFEDVAFW